MKDVVIDFGLGETYKGTNAAGTEINSALEGRTYEFAVTEAVAAAMNMSKRTVGRRLTARVFRNDTGGTLTPKKLYKIDLTAGIAGTGKVTSVAGAGDRYAYVCDPAISGTVAADDLFLGIVKGPTVVSLNSLSLTGGDILVTDAAGDAKAQTTEDFNLHLGTALQTVATATEVEVDLCPGWN